MNYKVVDKKAATLTGVKESLTRKCGTTRNLLSGIKAKDAAGVNLTSQISVYIKTPSGDGYEKCENTRYTFEEVGTYQVKFVIKNPNNGKKTTKRQTITVISNDMPILSSLDDWKELNVKGDQTIYWDDLMKDVTAKLSDGEDITDTVEVTITTPSGDSSTIMKGQKYLFEGTGTYTITYTAFYEDHITEKTRSLTVSAETQAEVILNE